MSEVKREFSVVFDEIEDGWIMARVTELPGAVTQGKDIKEAVEVLTTRYREHLPTQVTPDAK